MDETFIVREGSLTVLTEKEDIIAPVGTVIYVPKLAAHGYRNDSDSIVKLIMIFTPGGDCEEFFREMYHLLNF